MLLLSGSSAMTRCSTSSCSKYLMRALLMGEPPSYEPNQKMHCNLSLCIRRPSLPARGYSPVLSGKVDEVNRRVFHVRIRLRISQVLR